MNSKLRLSTQSLAPLLLVGVSVWLGCSKSDIQLAKVNGTVLQQGRPLPDAWVEFSPEAQGRPSGARTAGDGTFILSYAGDLKGALPGKYTVTIGAGGVPDPKVTKGVVFTPRVALYEETNVEVKTGSNIFEFNVPAAPVHLGKK